MPSLLKGKNSKKLATILRPVPDGPYDDSALHSEKRDIAAQEQQRSDDERNPITSSPTRTATIWRRKQSNKPTKKRPSSPVETEETLKYAFPADIIGLYQQGKIQRKDKEEKSPKQEKSPKRERPPLHHRNKSSQSSSKFSKRTARPVIPTGRCDQPLPALPFFEEAALDEFESRLCRSPLLTNQMLLEDLNVSPLSQFQVRPTSSGGFEKRLSQATPPPVRLLRRSKSAFDSSSSSVYSRESDTSSMRSCRSSKTSVEFDTSFKQGIKWKPLEIPDYHALIQDNALHPMLDTEKMVLSGEEHPPNAPSLKPPRRYHHPSACEKEVVLQEVVLQAPFELSDTNYIPDTVVSEPTKERRFSDRSGPQLAIPPCPPLDMDALASLDNLSSHSPATPRGHSPTLSEAENALHKQLTWCGAASDVRADGQEKAPLAEDITFQWHVRQDSSGGESESETFPTGLSSLFDHLAPPPVPRKSSKRRTGAKGPEPPRPPKNHIAAQVVRNQSKKSKTLTLMIPPCKRTSVDVVLSQLPTDEGEATPTETNADPIITPSSAETLILNIFRHLGHFEDLFSTALVNHGFYRVFKRHELELIKSTLKTMSPPAWEFREIAFPGHDLLHEEDLEMTRPEEEYTPMSYLKLQKQDVQVIRAIKMEILEKCQSFVRPEITVALMSSSPKESARVDDALWRIWTFCKIFGSGKGREDDLVAQIDWLKGGTLAHQSTCTFSISGTDFMNDTLVGMSESFAKGNEGGLTAEQLFDMMELWNCLAVLLQSFEGRTVQARQAGVYENTDVRGGDIDGEELMLDEWCHYLLTFGPAAVLKLTGTYHPSDPTGFKIARQNGWMNWTPPPAGSTRRKFLREATSRIYEDKIANKYAKTSARQVQLQQSKERMQRHMSELHQRKNSGELRPTIRMSQERPISEWDTVLRNLIRPPIPTKDSTGDIVTHIPALRSASVMPEEQILVSELPASRTPSPPRRTVARPLLPTPPASTVLSAAEHRSLMANQPSIEEPPASPPRRVIAEPLLPSPSASTIQSNRDLYTAGSTSSRSSTPRRIVAQPLLPTPSVSTASNSIDWTGYPNGTSRPAIVENAPSRHPLSVCPTPHPFVFPPSLPPHPAFCRDTDTSAARVTSLTLQQQERLRQIFSSPSHENTAEKAVYRIVEMGFTPEQAREALRVTDLGTGLRVDCAVELLLSRHAWR